MKQIKISDNKRFLVREDGSPFFYLGDTAWELFHRLDRREAGDYLDDRAAKKFTVIQAVVLAEHEADKPGPSGHLPLIDNDPAQPNEPYFAHVDWLVGEAGRRGLTLGMLRPGATSGTSAGARGRRSSRPRTPARSGGSSGGATPTPI